MRFLHAVFTCLWIWTVNSRAYIGGVGATCMGEDSFWSWGGDGPLPPIWGQWMDARDSGLANTDSNKLSLKINRAPIKQHLVLYRVHQTVFVVYCKFYFTQRWIVMKFLSDCLLFSQWYTLQFITFRLFYIATHCCFYIHFILISLARDLVPV